MIINVFLLLLRIKKSISLIILLNYYVNIEHILY